MKKTNLLILLSVLLSSLSMAQEGFSIYPESCTSIMVGKTASTDGSVMTAHSCDGNYRTWVNIVPAADHEPGTMHEIFWGTLNTEFIDDTRKLELKGAIPEVPHTFAFLNTAYPCMNEKGLAIGETTIYGRRELRNENGLFLIENLEVLALQRCTTARDAIQLIAELVEQYGYGDFGECLTFADQNEVWQFEIFGSGPGEPSAVWAARRIPDNHIGISANISRIAELDPNDSDLMFSQNCREVATKMNLWDGKEPFKFYRAFSGDRCFSTREFFVLSTAAPSLNLSMDAQELPFSVKPEHKMSPRDVMAYYRQTYEGTDFDMTKNLLTDGKTNPVANPWMSRDLMNLLNDLKPGTVERQRTIAIPFCSYSHIIQLRSGMPEGLTGIAWLALDNPAESPRFPVFTGTMSLPESFDVCGQHQFRTDAALWSYRRANRLATVRWQEGRKDIESAIMDFENRAFNELPAVQQTAFNLYLQDDSESKDLYKKYLTQYTHDFANATIKKWWELGDAFFYKMARGF